MAKPREGGFRFNLHLEWGRRTRRKQGAAKPAFSRLNVPHPSRRALLVGLALLAPLLLIVSLWLSGILALPRLEALTGIHPRLEDEAETPKLGPSILVDRPRMGEQIQEPILFTGVARPEARVYIWEKHRNVPIIVPASRTGHWQYTFHPSSLSEGAHTLVFADNDGSTWQDLVERTVLILPQPLQEDAPPTPTFLERTLPPIVAQPILTLFRTAQALLAPITVTIAETDAFNLQNDLNQDSVPDWWQQSGVPPDAIPAGLTPIIDSPAWLNLILLVLLIATPVTVLIVKNPHWLGPAVRDQLRARLQDRREKRLHALGRQKLRAQTDLEQDALRLGARGREEVLRAKAKHKKNALDVFLQATRLKKEARLYEAQAAAASAAARAQADVAVEAKRSEARLQAKAADEKIQRLRLDEARLKTGSAPTIIKIDSPQGAFRPRKKGKRKR